MGCCSSTADGVDPEEVKGDRLIKIEMEKAQETQRRVDKILLLGAGESGKSTLFKQMRIIYGNGFSESSLIGFRTVLHANIIAAIQLLLRAVAPLRENKIPGIEIQIQSNQDNASALSLLQPQQFLDEKMGQQIAAMWADEGIQNRYKHRHLFLLSDSAKYFLDKVTEMSKEDYKPTIDDVLRARVQTQGIVEDQFNFDFNGRKETISMFDVGGQRSERRHWLHCFEGVTAVLFVAALNVYDMVLVEDGTTNRMMEALNLFEDVCGSRWFQKSSIILFLNKRDLFSEKISRVPLTTLFEDYNGENGNEEQGLEFLRTKFVSMNTKERDVVVHFTTATDTELVKKIFEDVKSIFVSGILDDAGLFAS